MPRRVRGLLSLGGQAGRGNILKVWKLALLCLMWCIWRERNVQSFENIETSMIELKMIIFNTLCTCWILAHHSLLFSSFSDF
jgi:hypothetical protein